MIEIYKVITYLVISFIICLASLKLESSFIDEFAKSFIGLLTTLLAINIASGSLIAGILKEISIQTGHYFEKTRNELKRSLTIQLILIALSFIVLILKTSKKLYELYNCDAISVIGNTITVTIFIYYLDTIRDLGKALFSVMGFNNDNKQK